MSVDIERLRGRAKDADERCMFVALSPGEITELLDRIEAAERERDEWKAQAEGESVVCDSYRNERDALAAHVEHLDSLRKNVIEAIRDDRFEDLDASFYRDDTQPPKPETSLAKLKAQWQAEALRDMVAVCSNEPWTADEILVRAEDLRRQAEEATHD